MKSSRSTPAKPFTALEEAARLHAENALPVVVAAAVDDGEGGVFIQLATAGLSTEDAEFVAGTMLREILRHMQKGGCDCPSCARRERRVRDALKALQRDGAVPTGESRGGLH